MGRIVTEPKREHMPNRLEAASGRRALGWASAVAVATLGLLGAMGTAPAAAQPADLITRGADEGGPYGEQRSLVLPIGKAAIIELPRAASDIIVSDPALIEAVVRTPRRVYVMARAAGQANIFFLDGRDQQILTLDVRIDQDTAVIEDMIERLLPNARIRAESANGTVVLSGTADTPADAQRALDIATRFVLGGGAEGGGGGGGEGGVSPVMNMIEVREPGQVMLKVRILEMQRSLIRQLGINLDGVAQLDEAQLQFFTNNGLGTGGLNGTGRFSGIGEISPINAALNAFEQNGLVKTLAEPSLVATSGAEAEFFAGGSVGFPIVQVQNNTAVTTAEFRPFGVELKFQPVVRSKGAISVTLATSVSDVNRALGVGDIPGFLQRAATTTIDLPSGASFAIAGLLQEDIQETVEGVPALKEAPVLGQLFRSQNFQSRQTELVIIATPYLVEPSTLAELTDPGEGFVPPTMVQQALLGQLEVAYGVHRRASAEARLQGPLGFILD